MSLKIFWTKIFSVAKQHSALARCRASAAGAGLRAQNPAFCALGRANSPACACSAHGSPAPCQAAVLHSNFCLFSATKRTIYLVYKNSIKLFCAVTILSSSIEIVGNPACTNLKFLKFATFLIKFCILTSS